MSDFINSVDVKVRVNIFCDGKVQSRTLHYPDGTMKTLGVYLPGEFEFHSDGPESVVMTAGEVEVNFPDGKGWQKIKTGEYAWKCGAGALMAMKFIKVEYAQHQMELSAWIQTGFGGFGGEELALTGFSGALPKRQLYS